MLTTQEASEYLRISHKTLERWRWEGTGPCFIKLGGAVRYRLQDLDDYVEGEIRSSTSGNRREEAV